MWRSLAIVLSLFAGQCLAGSATLQWVAPTELQDGSPLNDLAGYKIRYGCAGSGSYPNEIDLAVPGATTFLVESLPDSGTCYFTLAAYRENGILGAFAMEASKDFGGGGSGGGGLVAAPRPPDNVQVQFNGDPIMPSIVGVGTNFAGFPASLQVGASSGAPDEGQYVVVGVYFSANSEAGYPSGYTLSGFDFLARISTGGFSDLYLLGKEAGPSEPSTYTPTPDDGNKYNYGSFIVVLDDVDLADPIGAIATFYDTAVNTSYVIPAIETESDGSLVLSIVAPGQDGSPGGGAKLSLWGAGTEIFDAFGTWIGAGASAATVATAGVQAATTVTSAHSNSSLAIRIEIRAPITAIEVPIAGVTEESSVLPFSISKSIEIGQVQEDSSAQPFAVESAIEVEIGAATEEASAQPASVSKTYPLAQVAEESSVLSFAAVKVNQIDQASEEASAFGFASSKSLAIAAVAEEASAFALSVFKDIAIAIVVEEDLAQPFTTGTGIPIVQVVTEDAAQAFTVSKDHSIAQAAEASGAGAFSKEKSKAIAQVAEESSAIAVSISRSYELGQVLEESSAIAFARSKDFAFGQVLEESSAGVFTPSFYTVLGQVREESSAQGFSYGKTLAIDFVTEENSALSFTLPIAGASVYFNSRQFIAADTERNSYQQVIG